MTIIYPKMILVSAPFLNAKRANFKRGTYNGDNKKSIFIINLEIKG